MTRRVALTLLVGAGVAACTPGGSADDPTASPDVDAGIRDQVVADEWSLVAQYDAVIAAQPSLAADLSPLRQHHVEHAQSLGSASPTTSSAPPASAATVTALADAETAATRQRGQACQSATGPDTARLLALIAASEAGHASYLRGLAQ